MTRSFKMLGVSLTFIMLILTIADIFAQTADGQEGKTYVSGITSARAKSLIGVALGASSLIIAWRVKARARNKGVGSKSWLVTGLILGLAGGLLSVFHLTTNTGGFGTGGGKAGAIVGLLVGVSGAVLNVLVQRSKKMSSNV